MAANAMPLCASRRLNTGSSYSGFIYWMCRVSDHAHTMSNATLMAAMGAGVRRHTPSAIQASALISWRR